MTSCTHTLQASHTARPGRRTAAQAASDFLKQWWKALWLYRARRGTVMILHSLDDHSLNDIGISRSEIESVVYGKPGERRVQFDGSRYQSLARST
jgi:uncharacterized protein YjiS (DUF1127 family)